MMVQKPKAAKTSRLDEAIEEYGIVNSIRHTQSLLFWDQEVNMPPGGGEARAKAMGDLEVLAKKELLGISPKIKYLKGRNPFERGMIKEFRSEIEYMRRIPDELLREMEAHSSRSLGVWRIAKEKDDFKRVQPYLQKMVEMKIRVTDHLGYDGHPYNGLLDLFEHEMTVKEVDRMFGDLLPRLEQIKRDTRIGAEHALENLEYSKSDMRKLTRELERMLKIPRNAFRSDVSAHPFSIPLDLRDIRITTTFEARNFKNSFFDSFHEFGHALYSLQKDPRLRATPAGDSASFGFEESQSRFWENIVGHSMGFIKVMQPLFEKYLKVKDSPSEIYKYFNLLKHDAVIRMASNELEYDSHIAMRYEIEKGLIAGEIKVSELPEVWNEHMLRYIGIIPVNDRDGVLQDMHWYGGDFGYFSTYTYGNIISGMIWKKFGNLDELIEQKKFDYIRKTLGEQIHRHGSLYDPRELLEMNFGKSYDQGDYIEYLEHKYLRRAE
ncbi:MAG: carboxypeptidase M32 [Candidatus Micrarchaeota archaeon]|nr:carboxypeptidase M32 [Candidatus Micrarchaeota archaeon]